MAQGRQKTPIRLSRRLSGGAEIVQGKSYIMLSYDELDDLIVDLCKYHGVPERVEELARVARS